MKVKFMSTDTTVKIIIFLLLVFVAVGDLFLLELLKSASKNTKSSLNAIVLSILPQKKFTNPNERTEKAVEEFEKEAGGQK